jgi:hypothetical protein
MLAFIRSASKAHSKTNVLTEIMFAHALKEAQDLDAEFARTGEIKGPRTSSFAHSSIPSLTFVSVYQYTASLSVSRTRSASRASTRQSASRKTSTMLQKKTPSS